MPATPTEAAYVQQEFRSAIWESATVLALYGKVARDTGDAPIDTFFDSVADVQTMVNERGALLGAHSRAFRVQIGRLVDLGGDYAMSSLLPGAHVTDTELVADMDCAVTNIESYNTESGQTTVAAWGII